MALDVSRIRRISVAADLSTYVVFAQYYFTSQRPGDCDRGIAVILTVTTLSLTTSSFHLAMCMPESCSPLRSTWNSEDQEQHFNHSVVVVLAAQG